MLCILILVVLVCDIHIIYVYIYLYVNICKSYYHRFVDLEIWDISEDSRTLESAGMCNTASWHGQNVSRSTHFSWSKELFLVVLLEANDVLAKDDPLLHMIPKVWDMLPALAEILLLIWRVLLNVNMSKLLCDVCRSANGSLMQKNDPKLGTVRRALPQGGVWQCLQLGNRFSSEPWSMKKVPTLKFRFMSWQIPLFFCQLAVFACSFCPKRCGHQIYRRSDTSSLISLSPRSRHRGIVGVRMESVLLFIAPCRTYVSVESRSIPHSSK